jgi:putative tryptophan/tyrosine transport system substrate-binding protein
MQPRLAAFLQALQQLGWTDGDNIRIDYRWGGGDADRIRKYAAELVALTPDVILATGTTATEQLLQASRTVPIVFVLVPDPVGAGYVDSLARPGRNATGFMSFEFGVSGKWLELLKEIAPRVTRAAVLRDPTTTAGIGQFVAAIACTRGTDKAKESRLANGPSTPTNGVRRPVASQTEFFSFSIVAAR